MNTRLVLISCLSLELFTPGCESGDSEPEPGEDASDFDCVEDVTVLGLDESSPLGFSAADVLAFAEGTHESPIHWHPGSIQFGPETGEGTLSVEIAHGDGEVRYVASEPKGGEGFGGECPDRLEIDADIVVKTAGGALDESFVGTLQAMRPGVAVLLEQREPGEIEGALEIESVEPAGGEATALTLGIGVSTFGLFGSIDGGIEIEDGDAVGFGPFNYATFPDAELACDFPFAAPVPFDADFGPFSAADALALLDAHTNHVLSWDGDEPTGLTLSATHDGAPICASLAPASEGEGDAPLAFGVQLTMLSEDGRLDGSLALVARAVTDAQGQLSELVLTHEAPYAEMAKPEEFAATYGVHGVDLSGYDGGGITFDASCRPDSSTGAITVLAATVHECSDEPGAPCEGTDMTELVGGTWTAQ